MDTRPGGSKSEYAHVFVYRITKKNQGALLSVLERLNSVYRKHGMLGSRTYHLGKTNVFEGFEGFEKTLGTSPDEEVFIEVDSYPSASEFQRLVAKIGEDQDAGPLWGELAQVTAGRPIIMGEFTKPSG